MEKILLELNSAQKDAVIYDAGPQLVVAGAGSGKTRMLIYKIAYLIKSGINPKRILALTFTNKAAKEMKSRIDSLIGSNISNTIWMGTFHSIFGRILRIEAEKIGFTKNFTIYDTSDSGNLIKAIVKDWKLPEDKYNYKLVRARISSAKNRLITPEAYAAHEDYLENDEKEMRGEFYKIYAEYVKRCKKSNVMDFDDLLLYTNILFKTNKESLEKFRNLFDYILVDEYQDTNFAQYLIIKRLSEVHRKLCVVGDDAQSIYAFRGARIQNILNFKKDYPDYKLFKLEQNYRSTQNIVNAANSLIEKNYSQIPKTLFSKNVNGDLIKIQKSESDKQEGYDVAAAISQMCSDSGYAYSDFAILYRTNAQSRIFEEAFRAFNIPYRIYGGLSFYQRKEIKDVLAYLRLVINFDDSEALRRIINYPLRKIGQSTIEKIFNYANENDISAWKVISNLDAHNLRITPLTKNSIANFVNLIKNLSNKINELDAYDFMVELVNRSGINDDLKNDKTPEGISRYENLQELLNSVKSFIEEKKQNTDIEIFITAFDFLDEVSLFTDLDQNDDKEDNLNRVSLMTVHAAKGLEFKNVFIVGVEEDLFPSYMSKASISEMEEERRLFYVAITRAMENLIISYAQKRFKFGHIVENGPSSFISDINPLYIQRLDNDDSEQDNSFDEDWDNYNYNLANNDFNLNKKNKITETINTTNTELQSDNKKLIPLNNYKKSNNLSNSDAQKYSVGTKITHNKFGIGTIMEVINSPNSTRLKIYFENEGTKMLALDESKIQILI